MSAPCLPCGLTPEQVITGLGELLDVGLADIGQPELAALVPLAERLGLAVAKLAEQPTPAAVLGAELAAGDAAADGLEEKKFGGGT